MAMQLNPLLRYLLESPQVAKNKIEVSDTGVGMQSNSQRAGIGNKYMSVREREASARAKVVGPKKAKKAKKNKAKLKTDKAEVPTAPPVQLPEPALEEELGLIGNM